MSQERAGVSADSSSSLVDPARLYPYDGRPRHSAAYLSDRVVQECIRGGGKGGKILDIGCGDGGIAGSLIDAGFDVVGIDPSERGIAIAREKYPSARFETRSVYDPLPPELRGYFDAVIAVEVIEHLYSPRTLLRVAHTALREEGTLILTTPYHGYFKNLVLAITGKLDAHFTAGWDGGHIKFWSRRSLSAVLKQEHFRVTDFHGAGRMPGLWKSMILVATRQANKPLHEAVLDR